MSILRSLIVESGFRKLIDNDPGMRRFLSKRFPDQSLEVAPNIYSNTPEYRRYIKGSGV